MKVYIVDRHNMPGRDFSIERGIIENAGHELIVESCHNEDEIIAKCSDANAILNTYTYMGEKSMKGLKDCKVMVRYGIGFDSFDADAATEAGIIICNIPHYCVEEVATHTAALILAVTRNLLSYTMNMRAGNYGIGSEEFLKMRRPSTQTLGLLGFGNIARTLGGYMKAFGYQIIAYDPYLDDAMFEKHDAHRVNLGELFAQADIISVNAPYTKETHHIINADSISKMKDGVVIVNTARGPLISEEAILAGLQSGKVAGAGLDVFEREPFAPKDHPFYHMNNVIISPHAAYNSAEATTALLQLVAHTAVAVLGGDYSVSIVNRKELGI